MSTSLHIKLMVPTVVKLQWCIEKDILIEINSFLM